MPLYIVRWPDLSISIVQARDRKELFWIVDEVGNPYECKIKRYDGPLHIALKLDVDYELEENPINARRTVVIKDASSCINEPKFQWTGHPGDTGVKMDEQIARFAFPQYAKYLDVCGWGESDLTEADVHKLCKEAFTKEFEPIDVRKSHWPPYEDLLGVSEELRE